MEWWKEERFGPGFIEWLSQPFFFSYENPYEDFGSPFFGCAHAPVYLILGSMQSKSSVVEIILVINGFHVVLELENQTTLVLCRKQYSPMGIACRCYQHLCFIEKKT
ncbi:hypothetical protein VNO77_29517 [Canavalia gladiata]|uniref:Uncharacterized protein n=1 Tax=Canavalia gladiata TaxID=3824 RepID=A0AAN9Q5E3_CANGL